jgi:hypothetical protein
MVLVSTVRKGMAVNNHYTCIAKIGCLLIHGNFNVVYACSCLPYVQLISTALIHTGEQIISFSF